MKDTRCISYKKDIRCIRYKKDIRRNSYKKDIRCISYKKDHSANNNLTASPKIDGLELTVGFIGHKQEVVRLQRQGQ